MSTGLDVRRAVNEANQVFRRYPARISLPAVLVAVLSYAGSALMLAQTAGIEANPTELERPFLLFITMVPIGFGFAWLGFLVEAAVSGMYLRVRQGAEPGMKQLREALRYPGLASLFWGLMVRYLGWMVLMMAIGIAVAAVVLVLPFGAHTGASSTSGVGAVAGGVGGFGAMAAGIAVVVMGAAIFYRYMFVLPMFAIARRSGPGFLDDCVGRTKRVWKTAALVLLAGSLPTFVLSSIESLTRRWLTPPHAAEVATDLAAALATGCFNAWFVLVRAGLALQLTATEALPSADSSTGLDADELPDGLTP